MKLNTIIFLCLTAFSTCYSQQKEITIISTNNFTPNDLNQLKQFESLLYGKKNKRQSDYKIIISSALDGISILMDNSNSKNLLVRQSTNTRFNDETELINYLNKYSGQSSLEFLTEFSKLNLIDFVSSTDIENLTSNIKKSKKSSIVIIWNNGFEPYIFSPEYINRQINSSKNNPSKYKPDIVKPNPVIEDILRPDESHYYFIFDSVGIFPSYEVSIYWKRFVGKNSSDEKVYDSVLLLKQCLPFTDEKDFLQNKSKIKTALYSIEDSKCKIALSESYIANLCYQNWKSNIDSKELPDESDEECAPCKYDCLYRKRFAIQVKGCATGVVLPNQMVGSSAFFQFQCNKKDLE
jgi:hypothetical protein